MCDAIGEQKSGRAIGTQRNWNPKESAEPVEILRGSVGAKENPNISGTLEGTKVIFNFSWVLSGATWGVRVNWLTKRDPRRLKR